MSYTASTSTSGGATSLWTRKIGPASRWLVAATIGISVLGFLHRATAGGRDPFALRLPNPLAAPWTLLTAGFYETSLIAFVAAGVALAEFATYFERAWGARELLKFVAVTQIASYLGVYGLILVDSAVTFNREILLGRTHHTCGTGALICGFVVAFRQVIPEHTVSLFRIIRVRIKHLPPTYLLGSTLLYVLGLIRVEYYILLCGFITSWIYLRFYKMQDGLQGDRSDTFSFVSFLPEALQAPVTPSINAIHNVLMGFGIVPATGPPPQLPTDRRQVLYTETDTYAPSTPATGPPIHASSHHRLDDAERRRQLALKALESRLGEQASS
ncbi:hypothetical protein CXG81DRAFT_29753 [Caulochytrium protostelioides]|uniref:DUF1751-domain-containing protein n=1 Tax=Caulochytrium protostelioides TaxID=1555241 RepID=A0A4P9X856_9FUNG|nr:hypothetical protein CXG81DRAFT_29753 [Caulochytrium protostelioides]|eukprot:RKP01412.1 hypothetical protein CXG81DRAFT_29753 [Caulochytrium protostelioides]